MNSHGCACFGINQFLKCMISNGLSILWIECGMCARVNSIIAANLKQLDDCLLYHNIYETTGLGWVGWDYDSLLHSSMF